MDNNDFDSFYDACRYGDHNKIISLLPHIDVNHRDNDTGISALLIACVRKHENVVKTLLVNGANVNIIINSSDTLMHWACYTSTPNIVRLLLSYGANVNSINNSRGPLFEACRQHETEVARILLENMANVNETDKDGYTPLFTAISQDNYNMVKLLLFYGADLFPTCNRITWKWIKQDIQDIIEDTMSVDFIATTVPFFKAVWPGDILLPLPPELIIHIASCMTNHEFSVIELEKIQQIAHAIEPQFGQYRHSQMYEIINSQK